MNNLKRLLAALFLFLMFFPVCAYALDEFDEEYINEIYIQNDDTYRKTKDVDYYDYYNDNIQDPDIQLIA